MSSALQPTVLSRAKSPLIAAPRCICGHPYTKEHKQLHPPASDNLTTAFATRPCFPCGFSNRPCMVFVDAKTDFYYDDGCLDCNDCGNWCLAEYETGSFNTGPLPKSTKSHTRCLGNKVWYYAGYKLLMDGSEEFTFSRDHPRYDTVDLPTPPLLTERAMTFLGGCGTSIVITVRPVMGDEDTEKGNYLATRLKSEQFE